MDEKVFAETGKVSPSLLSEWEVKAHAAAQAKSDSRMENYGKVNIGGGKFIDQSAVDLVARRNVQPVLDEIDEKAQAERERVAAEKMEQETQARKAAEQKAREREKQEIEKKLKRELYPYSEKIALTQV
jgi:phage-related minor tail protein